MNYDEWKWWQDKIHDYKQIDGLSDEEFRRLVGCCLEFIINSIQPERSKREDSEYGAKCDFGILKSEIRCSEQSGN